MKSREVYLDVYIHSIDPLDFKVTPSPQNDPPLKTGPDDVIIFENDHHPGFDIFFELKGNTFGYYFPNDKHQAVWSQLGNKCPDTKVNDVFIPLQVFDPPYPISPSQRTLLKVKNPNGKDSNGKGQGRFQYTLRVTNDGGKTYLPLDPGGDNMNGPVRFESAWSYAAVGIGSAFATAAVFAVAVSLAGFDLICPARF